MTTLITVEDVKGILRARMEEDLPDRVLNVFSVHAGKKLTKHLLKHLPDVDGVSGEEGWRLSHYCGMTHLDTWSYTRSQGNRGYHFLLAYSEKYVEINPETLQEHNSCYFYARRERNAERQATLNDPVRLYTMTMAIRSVRDARGALKEAEAVFDGAKGFEADGYVWKKLTEEED